MARLEVLEAQKCRLNMESGVLTWHVCKLHEEIYVLQMQDEEDESFERKAKKWWRVATFSVFGPRPGYDERSKEVRDETRLQRVAATRIREHEIQRLNDDAAKKDMAVSRLTAAITLEEAKLRDIVQKREQLRRKVRRQMGGHNQRGSWKRETLEESLRRQKAKWDWKDGKRAFG